MPKREIILNPGERLPTKWEEFLKEHFSKDELQRLERFGGRVQLSLTAPFVSRDPNAPILQLEDVLRKLHNASPVSVREVLAPLTMDQIKMIAKELNFPIRSKASIDEARGNLYDHLVSSFVWRGISGSTESSGSL